MASDPDDGVHSIASIGASMEAQKGNGLAPPKGRALRSYFTNLGELNSKYIVPNF